MIGNLIDIGLAIFVVLALGRSIANRKLIYDLSIEVGAMQDKLTEAQSGVTRVRRALNEHIILRHQ